MKISKLINYLRDMCWNGQGTRVPAQHWWDSCKGWLCIAGYLFAFDSKYLGWEFKVFVGLAYPDKDTYCV